MANFHY